MDPKEALNQALAIARAIRERSEEIDRRTSDENDDYMNDGAIGDMDDQARDGEALAEALLALDAWVRNGGFLPEWPREAR